MTMGTNWNREEIVTRLASQLERLLAHASAPAAELERTYGPGKWSARQVLAHVADVEFINYWRFCRAVAEPGSSVEAFEENDWEKTFDYAKRPVEISRELIRGPRLAFLHAAKTLPDAVLANACLHPQKGQMSGHAWLALQVAHTEHHLGQIEAAREQRKWEPVLTADSWKYGAKPKT